ncbi:MAG: alpha/beta hydrolase [Candidatus Omnitrophota bacterium]
MKIKHLILYVFLAIMTPFFIPSNAHGGINIDLNLPVGFKSISPVQFSVIRDDHLTLKGKVMPDFQIKSVSIKGTEARIEDNNFEFSRLQLKEGLNTFLISMADTNGRRRLVSYSVYSEPGGPMQGGGRISDGPVVDVGAAAEGYTAPPKKKLSTRTERRIEQPKELQKGKDQDVVFSSPYSGQVITEKELKIGGRFNLNAGITSITVNGQPCALNKPAGTFEGPMLICPGKAREYNVNADSPKYILMRVDPNTHSGENILKVKVTLDTGKSYEDRIVYNYYQLFVYSSTNNRTHVERSVLSPLTGEYVIVPEDYDYYNTDAYNSDFLQESPFAGWADVKYDTRDIFPIYSTNTHQNNHGRYNYYDRGTAYYSIGSYPWIAGGFFLHDSLFNVQDGATREDTINMTLHSPPKQTNKYTIIFKDCWFIETSNMFWMDKNWWNVPLDVSRYKANGISMGYLSEPLIKKEPLNLCKPLHTYVVFDNDNPDKDFQLVIDAPLYPGFASSPGPVTRLFCANVEYGITGDILIDSNNDGFLGGEDNAVEQNEPGCVFWVNDDDDYDDSPVHQDDKDAVNSKGNDSADGNINGIRDLEDFMPINISVPNIKEWIGQDKGIKYKLNAEGTGRIKLFERVKDLKDLMYFTYLKDLNSSIEQYRKTVVLNLSAKDQKELDPKYFDDNGDFCALFEGVEPGRLKVILAVEFSNGKKKEEIILDEVYITVKNVRDMYRFVDVRGGTSIDMDGQLRYRNISVEKHDMFMKDPSSIIMFIHGAWTPKKSAIEWNNTIYKRLYWSGYRGGFIGFSWDTEEGLGGLDNPKMLFDNQWVNSFQTGQVLADIIEDTKSEYKNARINILAHSLGGNLISYALRLLATQGKKGLVDNVFLAQVAVPGNAYASRPEIDYYKDMYVPSIENNITGIMYNLYYRGDKIIDLFKRDLEGVWWSGILGKYGLPVPLDDEYILLPIHDMYDYLNVGGYRFEISKSGGLGGQDIKSKISNFDSIRYGPNTVHPYGIRDHLSIGNEYYYDVVEYYDTLILKNILIRR